MASEIHDADRLIPENRGSHLDTLEARAIAEGLLVRQRPREPGVYDVSDGRAFRATPVVIDPHWLAKRKATHAANGQGEG